LFPLEQKSVNPASKQQKKEDTILIIQPENLQILK